MALSVRILTCPRPALADCDPLRARNTKEPKTAEFVNTAIETSLMKRRPQPGLIFHSNQGHQYVSGPVRKILKRHGARLSMGTRGDYYDNALVESLWHTLKVASINDEALLSRLETTRKLGDFIDTLFNKKRSL